MKRTTLLIILFAVGAMTFAQKKGKMKGGTPVTLTTVSPTFGAFEGNPEYDFIGDTITYKVIGSANYDDVFSESAIIYATLAQMNGVLDKMEEYEENDAFTIAAKAFMATTLPAMLPRAKILLTGMASLKPKKDFPGIKGKAKIPGAVAGIAQSTKYLKATTDLIPQVKEKMKSNEDEEADTDDQ